MDKALYSSPIRLGTLEEGRTREYHSDISDLVVFNLDDYVVTPAFSMADAIKAAPAEKFDLYIVGYYLPDGTGLELCLMLRAFDKETPILFATTASSITEKQVITAGAQGLVKKGVLFANDLRTKVLSIG